MKRCTRCGQVRPLGEFAPDKRRRDGKQSHCRPCQRVYGAQYRPLHRDRMRTYSKAYYRANPERWQYDASAVNLAQKRQYTQAWRQSHPGWVQLLNRANNAVRRALKTGRLVRPQTCQHCGATGRKIAGAHHDYTRPLEVTWLCYPCHSRWDHADPKLPRERAS